MPKRIVVDRGHEDLVVAAALTKLKRSKLDRGSMTDPIDFVRSVLGHKTWGIQEDILRSIKNHDKTAVKACHASSKTFTAADAVLWWITSQDDGKAVTTAPTWVQVKNLLWGEIHKAVATSKYPYPQPNQTELKLSPTNYAMGFSTDSADRFQGWHGNILIVFDEAAGVRPGLWEAAEGIRAGGDVRMLVIGNPTVAGGPFYDCFTSKQHIWNTITISAFDTPNLEGETLASVMAHPPDDPWLDHNPWPMLVTRRWVYDRYMDWGPDSPMFESRVLGNFPSQGIDALYPLDWLEAARYREVLEDSVAPYTIGIDVAGPGEDETVIVVLRGYDVMEVSAFTQPDARPYVAQRLERYPRELISTINVDSVGIGWYFAMDLKSQGYNVQTINMQEQPFDDTRYQDFRSEVMWKVRENLQAGRYTNLYDDTLRSQASVIKYEQVTRNKIKVESKQDMLKRGIHSPDRLEAFVMAGIPPIQRTGPLLPTNYVPRLFIPGGEGTLKGKRFFQGFRR